MGKWENEKVRKRESEFFQFSHFLVFPLSHFPIVLLLLLASLYLSDFAWCYTISVGHFSPSSNTFTYLLITDLSGSGPSVDISFYDDSGRLISASSKLLPPNGKIRLPVDARLRKAGNIVVESPNEQIIGEYWQFYENGSVIVIPLQPSTDQKRYFVNGYRFQPCNSGLLVVSDPYGSGPIVQMEFYNKAGKLVDTTSNTLRPHGVLIHELGSNIPWDDLGKISIKSLRGSIVHHCRYLCGNNVALAVSARPPAKELLVSKFSAIKTANWKGSLMIIDTTGEGPAVEIQLLSEKKSKLSKLLPPNGSIMIDISDYAGDIKEGSIQISGSAAIIANYWERNQQGIINIPAIGRFGSVLAISRFLPSKNVQDSLSLLNFGQVSVKVEVQFYTEEGKKLGSKEILLKPYKYFEEPMVRFFGDINLGTVVVRCPNSNVSASSSIGNNQFMGTVISEQ